MAIFDSQIDCGKNLFGPDSDLVKYASVRPDSFTHALVIPTGTHVLSRDGVVETSCVWEVVGGVLRYKSIVENGKDVQISFNPSSPYVNMNSFVLEQLRVQNLLNGDFKFYFCPKFHPKLDRPDDIEKFLDEPETKAVKVQGVATFCGPKDIPSWLVDMVRKRDLPLLVHTDCYVDGSNSVDFSVRSPFLHYAVNLNTPLNWAVFGIENNVRLYLAHGLRLCQYTADVIKGNNDFLVGVGPDFSLNVERESLFGSGDYLTRLFELVSPRQLAFNTDFAWNFYYRLKVDELDWDSHLRIREVIDGSGKDDSGCVLFDNAAEFFKI